MSTSRVSTGSAAAAKSVSLKVDEAQAVPRRGGRWQTYLTTISRGDSRFSRFDHHHT